MTVVSENSAAYVIMDAVGLLLINFGEASIKDGRIVNGHDQKHSIHCLLDLPFALCPLPFAC